MSFKFCTATAAVLLAISAGGVMAQPPAAARPDAPPAAISHGASGAAIEPTSSASAALPGGASGDRSGHGSVSGAGYGPVYRSAFDGYRAFADQPVLSWRESNDLVGRIGGWQAYAREAQGAPAAAPSPGTPATAAPSMPGMSGMPASHGGMKMPPSVDGTPAASGDHSGPRKP